MIRVGFIGRTKSLFDTIRLFAHSEEFEVSFIWTCKGEDYYEFDSKNFELLANELGTKYFCSPFISQFESVVEADVVVSINFKNIIPKSFINKFEFGVINAHAGDLPRYRGNACPNWAILNNESHVVLTFHQMDEGLDSGHIIRKEKFPLADNTYIEEVYGWLNKAIPSGFVDALNMLIQGHPPKKQIGRPLRCFPRKPEDAKINFNKALQWNYRLIRASSRPFSGAFAFLNNTDTKVTVFRAEPFELRYDILAVNGQIIEKFDRDKSFLIAIGNQALRVIDYTVNGQTLEESFNVICKSMRNRLT